MSNLKKYLDANHSSPDKIKNDFQNHFGVNVRQEGNKFLFKYGIISSNWKNPVTHECRGSILQLGNHGWDFLSRPFDKFFNQHEGYCPVFKPEDFEEALPNSVLVAKADGTCIQVWHDGDKWRISTLGTIITQNVYDSDLTFEELFLKTVGKVFWNELDSNFTYLFELCTDQNRIVTEYPEDHTVLLSARNRSSGEYLQDIELDHKIYYGAFREANVVRPQLVWPHDLGLTKLDDVKSFVEESSTSEKYGRWPEGFVLYDSKEFHPIAKMKNAQYVSLHSFGGGNIAHSKNQIIDAIFLGFVDDIYEVLSDRLKLFADDVQKQAKEICQDIHQTADEISAKSFPNRKAFALFVQKHANKNAKSFFFENANDFINHHVDLADNIVPVFEKWLKKNYKKFEWKNKNDQK